MELFLLAFRTAGIHAIKTTENGEHDEDRKREHKRNREELEQLRHVRNFNRQVVSMSTTDPNTEIPNRSVAETATATIWNLWAFAGMVDRKTGARLGSAAWDGTFQRFTSGGLTSPSFSCFPWEEAY